MKTERRKRRVRGEESIFLTSNLIIWNHSEERQDGNTVIPKRLLVLF